MTQTPLNIFSLLVGDLNSPTGGPIAGKSQPGAESSELFGDLISSFLASHGEAVTVPTGQAEVMPNGIVETAVLVEEAVKGQGEIMPEAIPQNVAEFNRQLLSILPRQVGVIRASAEDILSHQAIDLEPGKYEILSSQIEDGKVSLELVSKDNPAQPIKLTLPTDVFANLDGLTTKRVALGDETYERNRLERMLSQLNLKEIEIESTGTGRQVTDHAEPVKITIVAESTAGERLLRAKLDKNRIRVSNGKNVAAPKTTSRIGAAEATSSGTPTRAGEFFSAQNYYSLNGEGAGRQEMLLNTAKPDLMTQLSRNDSGVQTADGQQITENIFGLETSSADYKSTMNKAEIQTARFTLPEDFGANLKANSRAVTLRIEPEHLGPARMSLTMTEDKLKAKIVVDSVPAKVALENNLDRLINDLNKADIKVDQIEISVKGDSAHNEFLGRQPHWRRRMVTRIPKLDTITSETADIPVAPPAAVTSEYAGPGGVNLLA